MKIFQIAWRRILAVMNNFKLRKKLVFFYCGCVLIPLILTDSIVLGILLHEEDTRELLEMKNVAAAVQYDLEYLLDDAKATTGQIYVNSYINNFFERTYPSRVEYYIASYEMLQKSATLYMNNDVNMLFYIDNNTITNGGHFFTIDYCRDEEWYKEFVDSGKNAYLCYYFAGDKGLLTTERKKISFIRKLDYYQDAKYEKFVKYDFDYSAIVRRLVNMKYTQPVYVCSGDTILFTNVGFSAYTVDFSMLTGKEDIGYERNFELYGQNIRVLVMNSENTILKELENNIFLLLLLISCNIILPAILVRLINQSFTERLRQLSQAFDMVKADSLSEIETIEGTDEIGNLMQNYNRMVNKSQELIKTVYKDKLEKQEIDIARQNAELMALHSQINPHFLFNVLESIRMHSVLKGEHETAEMIERLAAMERRSVEWSSDYVKVKDEVKFIKDYFELQKYRFGDRLSYQIDLKEDCEDFYLPRLTLTTFAENACVHGVEKKSTICWVYVRVYRKDDWLYLEIEDTGTGIEEERVAEIKQRVVEGNIGSLKEQKHIGMINAFLRLKMITEGEVEFEIESEEGVGTFMVLRIAVKYLTKERSKLPC